MAFPSLTQFNLHSLLANSAGVAIVFFTRPGCASCRHWRVLLSRYAATHPAHTVFEVNAETDAALTREFDVYHLPALFLYVEGKFHAPIECRANVEALAETIGGLQSGPAHEPP